MMTLRRCPITPKAFANNAEAVGYNAEGVR